MGETNAGEGEVCKNEKGDLEEYEGEIARAAAF